MPLHVKLSHSKRLTFKPGLRRHVQTPSVYTEGPSAASPSTLFSGPVIYANVLIGVYLCPTVSLPESTSDEQPGFPGWVENYPPELLFVLPPILSCFAPRDFPFSSTVKSDSEVGVNGCLGSARVSSCRFSDQAKSLFFTWA